MPEATTPEQAQDKPHPSTFKQGMRDFLGWVNQFLSRNGWLIILGAMAVGGVSALYKQVPTDGSCGDGCSHLALSLLVAGGFALIGALAGFLFAIPRSLSNPRSALEVRDTDNEKPLPYRANTNLEEISDWLTKILVGVGLTQLVRLPKFLNQVAARLDPAVGGSHVAIAIILYFTPLGFLTGYLWTRMFAPLLFTLAERQSAEERAEFKSEVKSEAKSEAKSEFREELKAAQLSNAEALASVRAFLNPRSRERQFSMLQLQEILKKASSDAVVQTRISASEALKTAVDNNYPWLAERAAAIFETMIELTPEDCRAIPHALLACSLSAMDPPDWERAIHHFDKAIELRGPWQNGGRLDYEFGRAAARIALDKPPHSESAKDRIKEDLMLAIKEMHRQALNVELKLLFRQHRRVADWLVKNNLVAELPAEVQTMVTQLAQLTPPPPSPPASDQRPPAAPPA